MDTHSGGRTSGRSRAPRRWARGPAPSRPLRKLPTRTIPKNPHEHDAASLAFTLRGAMSSAMDTRASAATSLPIDYNKRLMLFAGRASPQLAVDIADKLQMDLGPVTLKTFSNGEVD